MTTKRNFVPWFRRSIMASVIATSFSLLTGCGGGGGSGGEATPESYKLLGAAIKGPLANAKVSVYQLDVNKTGLKGKLVTTAHTDTKAKLAAIDLNGPLADYYLVEYTRDTATLDLATGKAPVMSTLSTLVSGNQLKNQTPVYATPMTTLVLQTLAQQFAENIDANLTSALKAANDAVVNELGFGYQQEGLIFSSPAHVMPDTSSLENVLKYRATNEALVGLLVALSQSYGLPMEQLLTAMAVDLSDAVLDGKANGNGIADYGSLSDPIAAINQIAIPWLGIPDTDKDGDATTRDPYLVAETALLLTQEMLATGVQRDVSMLTNGQITYRPKPRGADADRDGYPNAIDAFPNDASEWLDSDQDHIGNNADNDDDNDGVLDTADELPLDPNESLDTDHDGIGNNADTDDDNDAIVDSDDAFPLDPTESVDTDRDGTGDNADAYPTQPLCHGQNDGDGETCYVTLLATEGFDKQLTDNQGVTYFLANSQNRIIRQMADGEHFLPAITLSAAHGAVQSWAYSANHKRIYLGYADGTVNRLTLATNPTVQFHVQLSGSVMGLADAGKYLLAQDNTGAWATHYVVDANGFVTDQQDWNYRSDAYAWSSSESRVYFFRSDTSPNDLHYEQINQLDGTISARGETPYHGSYDIVGPIRVSAAAEHVLLGSGDLYRKGDLVWQANLGGAFVDASWDHDGGVIILKHNGADSALFRRNAQFKMVEQRLFDGEPIAVAKAGTAYKVITRTADQLITTLYTPSDDSDEDGASNADDAFPTDPSAALDSDGDGYPDAWNPGRTQADSTTGLQLDWFPNDSACWLESHGIDGVCNYAATMPDFQPDQVFQDDAGIVYLYSKINHRIYRWSSETESYLNPLTVGQAGALVTDAPERVAFSASHQRIYLGYKEGAIRYLNLLQPNAEHEYTNLAMTVTGLAAAGNYVMASDSSGAWHTHYVIDHDGAITDSAEWNYYSRYWTWDTARNRMYFFRDQQSPNDLHFETISQSNGTITGSGETSYHGDYSIDGPIRVNADGGRVFIGSGHLFQAPALTHVRSLPNPVVDAAWSNNQFVTVRAQTETSSTLTVWQNDGEQAIGNLNYQGAPLALLPIGDELLLIAKGDTGFHYHRVPMADNDADGLPGWWEQQYGLNDNDPSDAAADADSDGLSNVEEFSHLTRPDVADSDNDGLSDGVEVNSHQTNPLKADTDGDGLSDGAEVNLYGSSPVEADTDGDTLADGHEVNTLHTNPLSADSDNDGMTDNWEVDHGLDPNVDDANVDNDSDGLSNLAEHANGTDPENEDTDADGLGDGDEVNVYGSNPTQSDSDGDRMKDGWEVVHAFSPTDAADAGTDADSDSFSNREEFFGATDPRDATAYPRAQAWMTYQGNAGHTGYVPLTLDTDEFSLRWSSSRVSEYGRRQVATASGQIFVSLQSSKQIVALDAVDGTERWTYSVNAETIDAPATANGKVYFQTGGHSNSFLRALNVEDGSLEFSSAYGNQWSSHFGPTPFADSVYVAGGYYGGSYGFNGETGAQQWFAQLSQYDGWTPAVDDRYIYSFTGRDIGSYRPALTVLDRATGAVAFNVTDASSGDTGWGMSTPSLGMESVFVTNTGRLLKIDLATRQLAWQINEGYNTGYSGPVTVANETIFALKNGVLMAIDERNGQTLWSWSPGYGGLSGNIVATRNLVFVHDDSNTYAIDRSSHLQVWSYPLAGEVAITDEGAIIIAADNGSLAVINYGGDQDDDGMPDWWETGYGLNPADAADAGNDPDVDGLTNLDEFTQRTNPTLSDTDEDGLSDGDEVNIHQTLPKDNDTDDDLLLDGDEIDIHGTNPKQADSDSDGFTDGDEINRYATDPNDAGSRPNALADFVESFEANAIPAGWVNANGSQGAWALDSMLAYSGNKSLRSGQIGHGGQTGIVFSGLFANSTLSFQYRTDTESCCDRLTVLVDGVEQLAKSGFNNWQTAQITLESGEHTIEWRYTKDGSVATGQDAIWIDDVTLIND